ncbi:MAG: hypothetical protein GC138_07590 [Gammaproteobacteria bacterium]|nr:hypothetical protein [Gammaproteobacteria bacterium]
MARQAIKASTLTIAFTALLAFAGSSMAADRDDWKKGNSDAQWDDFRMVQTERHEMIVGIMKITKDLVNIVNNLNHHPSEADKVQLQEMGKKLDELIAKDDELSRKMAGKWNQKWQDKK